MARETSRYFPSIKLTELNERPEHIQLDIEAWTTDFKNQLTDYIGRASDEDHKQIVHLFCGKPNKRKTRVQLMFENQLKELRSYK